MELWIRSQDKTFLRKVNTIGIVEGRDFWGIEDNFRVSLGKYKTKERALEVLDEIQNIIQPKYILNSVNTKSIGNAYYTKNGIIYKNGSNEGSIHEISTLVYEMPEK